MSPGRGTRMSSDLTFLVPGSPDQRTGGYTYVRRIVEGLRAAGQAVRLQGLDGEFPETDPRAQSAMDQALDALEDGTTVVIDGLALSGLPPLAERHTRRLRIVALVHHPLADEPDLDESRRQRFFDSERRALAVVSGVIVTSDFTARRLADYDVSPARLAVVVPGVHVPQRLEPRVKLDAPFEFLCVATLAPRKGQDLLVQALARCPSDAWHCTLAGSLDRYPAYVADLRRQIETLGLEDRIDLCGELDDAGLDQSYREADAFVLPSWYEGYGMVITEALAYGLPVITTSGGALAYTADNPASIKVEPGDVDALAAALSQLLDQPQRLQQLVAAAAEQRRTLPQWSDAAAQFRSALETLTQP